MPPPGEKCGSWGSIPTTSHTNLPLACERSGLPRREYSRLGCMAAIQASANYLLTGDRDHFGAYFDKRIEGVRVLRPAGYLSLRRPE